MNTTYITPAQAAATVRAALKAKGWTSRQVSVRADQFAGGSAVDVVIKDLSVPLAEVKAIAAEQERISRCEISGEILSGGNRYVSVRYSYEAIEAAAERILPAIQGLEAGAVVVIDQVQVSRVAGDQFALIDLATRRSVGRCTFIARGADQAIVEIVASRGRP